MAITFPRDLPSVGFVSVTLNLDEGVTVSRTRGRAANYTQFRPPMWFAAFETAPLDREQAALVEGWWLSLNGLNKVRFCPPHAPYPLRHRVDKAPANDTGVLSSISNGNVLSVSSVTAGLVLTVGDFIGLERNSRYFLGQVTETSGSGTTRIITVGPTPYSAVAQDGAIVRFASPIALMRPVPNSFEKSRVNGLWVISFSLEECD